MAKICMVPERMKGSATSPLSEVRQPSVIAHSNRTESSSPPSGLAKASLAHRWKRTDIGTGGGFASSSSFQSLNDFVRS